jgi:hypothetical protein
VAEAPTLADIILKAALITGESDDKLAEVLGKSKEQIAKARADFPACGYGRLDKLQYITEVENKSERVYLLWAYSNGLNFIKWKLGLIPDMDPVTAVKQLFTDTIMKSREAIYFSNTEEESKEATKWTALSVQLAKLLKSWVLDSEAAVHDLHIALEGSNLSDMPGLEDLV